MKYERDHLPVRGVVGVVVIAALVGVATLIVAALMTPSFAQLARAPSEVDASVNGIHQTAFTTTRGDGRARRARQEAALERFSVIDAAAGVAAIPIDVAMDAVVAEQEGEHGR